MIREIWLSMLASDTPDLPPELRACRAGAPVLATFG
jgi:hypothetical protein